MSMKDAHDNLIKNTLHNDVQSQSSVPDTGEPPSQQSSDTLTQEHHSSMAQFNPPEQDQTPPSPPEQDSESEQPPPSSAQSSDDDFEKIFLETIQQQLTPPPVHKIIKGKIIYIGEKSVVVDIHYRAEGVIPIEEFTEDELAQLHDGDEIEIYVLPYREDGEYIPLSYQTARQHRAFEKIREAFEENRAIPARIVERLKGGYFVDIDGVRAFLPGSQVDIKKVEDFDEWIGKDIIVKVLNFDEQKKSIIVSRRICIEEQLTREREEKLSQLYRGAVVEGKVKNITDYGVFVDLGGVDGMIHKSDLSWQRIEHPSDVVEIGQTIRVKVLDIDRDKHRIALGLKQLEPEPWKKFTSEYKVGDTVKAKVQRIVNFGAFVEIIPGVTGLIHISEMAWSGKIRHPSQVVKEGDFVEAKIIHLNQQEKKVDLSLRQVTPHPIDQFLAEHPVGSVVTGEVFRFIMKGAFVRFEDHPDVLGFIPVREINWRRKVEPPSEYLDFGARVRAKILRVQRDQLRVILSIRQLMENPWVSFAESYPEGSIVKGVVVEKIDKGAFIHFDFHPDVEALLPRTHYERKRVKKKAQIIEPEVGETLELKVIQVVPDKRKIVVSRKEFIQTKVKEDVMKAREKVRKDDRIYLGDIANQLKALKDKLGAQSKKSSSSDSGEVNDEE